MNLKLFISIIATALIFVSCERDVLFNGEITKPNVIVNSFISPDSVISAHVSVSRFFLKDSIDFRDVNNAEVNLWVNGILKEKLISDTLGIYTGKYKPALSDNIKLTVDVPQMTQVSGTTTFSEAPIILSVDTQIVYNSNQYLSFPGSNDTLGIQYRYKVNYKLKFKDNGSQKNYYRLLVGKVSYTGDWNENTNKIDTVVNNNLPVYSNFDFTDVVSGNTQNPLTADGSSPLSELMSNQNNEYHVFSDDMFNGKTYTLQFSTNQVTQRYFSMADIRYSYANTLKNKVYVSLQSISKEYYQYLISRSASKTTNYFSEPVQVYSNITGGTGILGSYTTSNIMKIMLP
jgi:Domain of unknown function (DUF4249)